MKTWRLIVGAALVLCLSLSAEATVFSGRVGLSSYIWQKTEPDSSETQHTQNTGPLSLRWARIGDRDLTISTSLRGRYDIRNAGDNVDDYYVHSLQFRWNNIADRADLTGGRQRVYWPTGTVHLDGGALSLRPVRRLEVSGYFGLTAPDDGRFKTVEYDDGHAFGAQVQFRPKNTSLSLSFSQKNQARKYVDFEVENLAYRRLALECRRTIAGFGSSYWHIGYDMLTQRLNRLHTSLRWQTNEDVSINGQFRYRRPDIPYNSIFWVFGEARYYEGRIRVNYRVNENWTVNVGGAYLDLVDDNATRFDLGVTHRYFNAMLHGKSGYAGSTIGVSGEVLYPLNEKWLLRGGTHLSSYELSDDADESNFEVSSWAGCQWRMMPQASLDFEAQLLTQDIKTQAVFDGDSGDFRLLVRLSYWFFKRLNG